VPSYTYFYIVVIECVVIECVIQHNYIGWNWISITDLVSN